MRDETLIPLSKVRSFHFGYKGIMRLSRMLVAMAVVGLPLGVQAGEASGLYFSHHDWELACDNTRTCRAAGYQRDGDSPAVSVLLTRRAGPYEPVTGELRIGELDGDAADSLASEGRLSLRIDGEFVGRVELAPGTLSAALSEREMAALLPALRRDSVIEWVAGDSRWRLSDTGAAAVLLKMDDFQGRVGTPGAMVRQGSRHEEDVLPPLPAPVVIAPPVVEGGAADRPLTSATLQEVREVLRATLEHVDECFGLAAPKDGGRELTASRLSDSRWLVSTLCWQAAYNMGEGYWVINDAPPYEPVLVTESGSFYEDGTITAAHKGRGIGDCWSRDDWTWDGEQFIHTASFSTGMCRLVAAGGAWTLPTRVTEVRRAAAGPSQ